MKLDGKDGEEDDEELLDTNASHIYVKTSKGLVLLHVFANGRGSACHLSK